MGKKIGSSILWGCHSIDSIPMVTTYVVYLFNLIVQLDIKCLEQLYILLAIWQYHEKPFAIGIIWRAAVKRASFNRISNGMHVHTLDRMQIF